MKGWYVLNKFNSYYGANNYGAQNYNLQPMKNISNHCNCFPSSPISPMQEQWFKICDYFNIGDPAPDFTLQGVYLDELIEVNLDQYLGKWVALFFYNADFTFV